MRRILFNLVLAVIVLFSFSCKKLENKPQPKPTNAVIESFHSETGINAVWVTDTSVLNSALRWQGKGDYPGVDNWATAKVPNSFYLYGGLPGQSEYYTISKTIKQSDTVMVTFWKYLQVKPHPTYGYRPMAGVYRFMDTLVVAISKTLANKQYGEGGAWQLYVKEYKTKLLVTDTIYLKK